MRKGRFTRKSIKIRYSVIDLPPVVHVEQAADDIAPQVIQKIPLKQRYVR